MKKFVISILKLLGLTLVFMVILEAVFTYVFYASPAKNKFQYIVKAQPQRIDYLFLGSSRVANHIVPEEVEKLTGKSALNLGVEGTTLRDNQMHLELLIDRKVEIGTLFLQVDYVFNLENGSVYALSDGLPFIHDPVIGRYINENFGNTWRYRTIPFLRYMSVDYVIGVRSLIESIRANPSAVTARGGFRPLDGYKKQKAYALPEFVAEKNKSVDRIRELCRENGIELVSYFSPICSSMGNLDYVIKLKQRLPDLMDYSTLFPDDAHFSDCRHLREDGALIFTRRLMTDYLDQKQAR